MRTIHIIAFLVLTGSAVSAGDYAPSLLDSLLKIHVTDGAVNYDELRLNDGLLREFLKSVETVSADEFERWTESARKAFWINTYNALVLALIIEEYPIEWGSIVQQIHFPKNSIRQLQNAWDRPLIRVFGSDISLNAIHHDILRIRYNDPRIHFMLVNSAVSGPECRPDACFETDLDQRLDLAAVHFLNNPKVVYLDRNANLLFLSPILGWYKNDFSRVSTGICSYPYQSESLCAVISYIARYLPEEDAAFIRANRPEIQFREFDWMLNEISLQPSHTSG